MDNWVDSHVCAHKCAVQSEVFCHLVLVASADIVPEATRGYFANVEVRTTTQKLHHKEQKSDIRRSCMVSQTELS